MTEYTDNSEEHATNHQYDSEDSSYNETDESFRRGPGRNRVRFHAYDTFHLNPSCGHSSENEEASRREGPFQNRAIKKDRHSDSESTIYNESETSEDVEKKKCSVKVRFWHFMSKIGRITFVYFVLASFLIILCTFAVKKNLNCTFYRLINADPLVYEEIPVNCRYIGYTMAFIIFFIGILAVFLKFSLTYIESSIDISEDYLTIVCHLNIHFSIIIVLTIILFILIYKGNLNLQFAKETSLDCGHVVNTLLFSTILIAIKSYYLKSVSFSFDHARHMKRVRTILRDSFFLKLLKAIKKIKRKERLEQITYTVPISAEQQPETTTLSQSIFNRIRGRVAPLFGRDLRRQLSENDELSHGENIFSQTRPGRTGQADDAEQESILRNDSQVGQEPNADHNNLKSETTEEAFVSVNETASKEPTKEFKTRFLKEKLTLQKLTDTLHDHNPSWTVKYPNVVSELGEKIFPNGLFHFLYAKTDTTKFTRKDQIALKKIFYRLSPRDISRESTKIKWSEKALMLKKSVKCEILEDLKEYFCCEKFFLLWINAMKVTHMLKNYRHYDDYEHQSSSEADLFDKMYQPTPVSESQESIEGFLDSPVDKNDTQERQNGTYPHTYENSRFDTQPDPPEYEYGQNKRTSQKRENETPKDSYSRIRQKQQISQEDHMPQKTSDKDSQNKYDRDSEKSKNGPSSPTQNIDKDKGNKKSPDKSNEQNRGSQKSPDKNKSECINAPDDTALPLESEIHLPEAATVPPFSHENLSKTAFANTFWTEDYEIEHKMAQARKVIKGEFTVSLIFKFFERRDSELYNLQRTLEQNNAAINRVSNFLTLVIFLVALSIFLSISLNKTDKTIDILSALFGTGFILNTTIKDAISSCVFVFCVQPYDIGDRIFITIDNHQENLVVSEINVLSTTFIKYDGLYVIIPNNVLNTKSITNIRRSTFLSESFYIDIRYDTPAASLEKLKYNVSLFLKSNPNMFTEFFYFNHHLIEDCNKLKLRIFIQYTENWQQFNKYLERRGIFLIFLNKCLNELHIKYTPLVQPIYLVGEEKRHKKL